MEEEEVGSGWNSVEGWKNSPNPLKMLEPKIHSAWVLYIKSINSIHQSLLSICQSINSYIHPSICHHHLYCSPSHRAKCFRANRPLAITKILLLPCFVPMLATCARLWYCHHPSYSSLSGIRIMEQITLLENSTVVDPSIIYFPLSLCIKLFHLSGHILLCIFYMQFFQYSSFETCHYCALTDQSCQI